MTPDYIKHIEDQSKAIRTSICGVPLGGDWAFISIKHAEENEAQQGRLIACADCMKKGRNL